MVGMIATVLKAPSDVENVAVASGPIVTGTLKMAHNSATTENVSVSGEPESGNMACDSNILL